MKPAAPRSYMVGLYTVREDAGAPKGAFGARIARVFDAESREVYIGGLKDAMAHASNLARMEMDSIRCPQCGSDEFIALGELASKVWLRCRRCGWTFAHPAPEEDLDLA